MKPKQFLIQPVKIVTIVAASMVLAGFFLPWTRLPFQFAQSMSAWDTVIDNLRDDVSYAAYLLLLPLSAVAIILTTVDGTPENNVTRLLKVAPIAIILGPFIYHAVDEELSKAGGAILISTSMLLRWGFYITFSGAIVLLIIASLKKKTGVPW